MLGLEHQAKVKQVRFFFGKILMRAQHAQKVLRGGQLGTGIVQVQTAVVEIVFVDRVSVSRDNGQTGGYLNALTQHVVKRGVVGVFVVCVE